MIVIAVLWYALGVFFTIRAWTRSLDFVLDSICMVIAILGGMLGPVAAVFFLLFDDDRPGRRCKEPRIIFKQQR